MNSVNMSLADRLLAFLFEVLRRLRGLCGKQTSERDTEGKGIEAQSSEVASAENVEHNAVARIKVSDISEYFLPALCELRSYFAYRQHPEGQRAPLQQYLTNCERQSESDYLAEIGRETEICDLSGLSDEARLNGTLEAISQRTPVIYKPLFGSQTTIDGVTFDLLGDPDFLILESDRYIIRDTTIHRMGAEKSDAGEVEPSEPGLEESFQVEPEEALGAGKKERPKVTKEGHSEITYQLQLCAWLFNEVFGAPPARLEVHSGDGTISNVPIDADKLAQAFDYLKNLVRLKVEDVQPYEPVATTKCHGCVFNTTCWPAAIANDDPALLLSVRSHAAKALHAEGIRIKDLHSYDEQRLSCLLYGWKTCTYENHIAVAKRIMTEAHSWTTEKPIVVDKPDIVKSASYVMFAPEGASPYQDNCNKVYLWGMQSFGDSAACYHSVAWFSADGDKDGWLKFLENARQVFAACGDEVQFFHWGSYARERVTEYCSDDRYPDDTGTAKKVIARMVDLLDRTRKSVVLPLSSYGHEAIEKYLSIASSRGEYAAEWAAVTLMEAARSGDALAQGEAIRQISMYNGEKLTSLWAILRWLCKTCGSDFVPGGDASCS